MGDPVAWTKYALENDWESRVSGRTTEVPSPYITVESEDSQVSLKKSDAIIVKDGGTATKTPGTLNWDEETTVSFVNIDIRTVDRNREELLDGLRSPGATRLFGKRDDVANTAERYGGLVGEVTRVVQRYRRGVNEFDRIEVTEVNDISNESGSNHYRAVVTVRFEQTLQNVEPTL